MKVILKPFEDTTHIRVGDKALLNLAGGGWQTIEIFAPEYEGHDGRRLSDIWNFRSRHGTSSRRYNEYVRPVDESGRILDVEDWVIVCDELNKDRYVIINKENGKEKK